MEFKDVKESEITFKDVIAHRKYCSIFLVSLRGQTCVMKVHHGCEPWRLPLETANREYNIFKCESTAYRRLSEAGVCAPGITPQFYGTMEKIEPILCLPHLKRFLGDDFPPTAIFLEYIPNMKDLSLSNYTKERMRNFINGMAIIHEAQVLHSDIYPRNMMVVEGNPERNIWIDFDRAQTFTGELTEKQKQSIELEQRLVDGIGELIEEDLEAGTQRSIFLFC